MITYSALHEAYFWVGQTSISIKTKQERSIMPPNSDKLPFLVKNLHLVLSQKSCQVHLAKLKVNSYSLNSLAVIVHCHLKYFPFAQCPGK